MKTPKAFNDNLKNDIITMEMLELALYSINKRAKNCRDKKNEYYQKGKMSGYKNDYSFKSVEKYKEQEQEYYEQKDFLLKELLKPICIHETTNKKQNRIRYYDYEDEYNELLSKAIYENCYFDNDEDDYVYFIDVIEVEEVKNYFMFFETPNYSFHIPINENDINSFKLEKVAINDLITKGKEINGLVSVQFCKKLIELVKEGNYEFI
ncbi:hypothetical protein [Brassicibacter mesophilus]|uniref:hypothetical protein n=1 Tax=Brassicibacter mesophilus TaxID=745119 RepID=UPI003D19C632